MVHDSTAKRRMSLSEFLEWEGEPEVRYELFSGVPVAMTPPRSNHRRLVAAFVQQIMNASRPPCVVEVEVGILSPTQRDTFYQADLALSCSPQPPDGLWMVDPLLIVEVLSPSTEATDRKVKLVDYRQLDSVREVLLVDAERPYCELHRRTDDGRWLTELTVDLEATLCLETIGAELSLAELYANVQIQRSDPQKDESE